jgi:hypothetical protein
MTSVNPARHSTSTYSAPRSSACARSEPLVFAPLEAAAFPGRPARDDDRPRTTLERPRHVDVLDAVQTELDHVHVGRGVPRGEELGHRLAGDGLTKQ